MKVNVIIKTSALIAIGIMVSVWNMSGQVSLKTTVSKSSMQQTAAQVLATIIASENQDPTIAALYPPGYLDYLQSLGNSPYPPVPVTKSKSSKMSMMSGMLPMDEQQSQSSPPMYQVIDLGTLVGGNQSSANAINNAGQVVGVSSTSGGYNHAFLWQSGSGMHDLGVFGTDNGIGFSSANGINSQGQIVGYSSTSLGTSHAFLLQNGIMQDLGAFGGNESSGQGVNSAGEVVGSYATIFADPAFLWQNGGYTNLGTLGGSYSEAWAINDSGQVAGDSQTSQGYDGAFLWQDGFMQSLGTIGGDVSAGYAINSSGEVVGSSTTSAGLQHGFLWDGSSMQDLGTLGGDNGYAYGINSSEQIVGSDSTSSGNQDAFLWQNGTMYDLNNLVFTEDSGWMLEEANAINDVGQIVGYGVNTNGFQDAFLLNPFVTLTYTGYPQFSSDTSVVPAEFGTTVPSNDIAPGSEGNYVDGLAKTKSYGCALCSLAAMLTSISGFESITPYQLDADLRSVNNGYENGCDVNWTAINVITHKAVGLADSKAISASLADQSALDQYLDDHCWGNRYRVILQLEANNDRNETHYIFVVGKTNGDWLVFDPGWSGAFDLNTSNPDSKLLSSLNGHLTGFTANTHNWVFTVTGVRTYQLNPPSNGSLSEVVHSPVELLVTDPNGSRVGYDSVTNADVFEIPGASYIRDYPILDADTDSGSAGDTNGIKTVSIPAPLGGSYSTALIGTASGNYTFDTSIVWSGNSETNLTTTGTTDIGIITTNSVFVVTPPIITSSSVASGMFSLSFTAQTGVSYAVQGVNSLLNTNWVTITTVTATNTNATANVLVSDPNMMFYRVVSQ